jgi:hypothetical protein
MNKISYIVLVVISVLFFYACKGKNAEKNNADAKSDSTKTTEVKVDDAKLLLGEWSLDLIGVNKSDVEFNITFSEGGKFLMVTTGASFDGTYEMNDKKIKIKTKAGDDSWNLVSISKDKLVVFDNNPKNKTEMTFTR